MRKNILLALVLISTVSIAGCMDKKRYNEKYYQTILCDELDGVMEQSLLDRTRIDCLTDTYAIEVDFSKKWAESVGQSLYYAQMTGKKPAVGLIVANSKKDKSHMKRLEVLAQKYDITIFTIQKETSNGYQ